MSRLYVARHAPPRGYLCIRSISSSLHVSNYLLSLSLQAGRQAGKQAGRQADRQSDKLLLRVLLQKKAMHTIVLYVWLNYEHIIPRKRETASRLLLIGIQFHRRDHSLTPCDCFFSIV